MTIALAIFGILVISACLFWVSHRVDDKGAIMQIRSYKFELFRRRVNYRTGEAFISTHIIERECVDPFVERIRIAKAHPGWGVAVFSSQIDEEFNTYFFDPHDDRRLGHS